MLTTESQFPEKAPTRYPKIYFILLLITAIFIFLYSSPVSWQWTNSGPQAEMSFKNPPPARQSLVEKGFLVYSGNCRIPDVDPWHPSIIHLIEKSAPLNCSEVYPALTITEGNVLRIVPEVVKGKNISIFTCCYRGIYRDKEGSSDDAVKTDKECKPINISAEISEEFISVECRLANGTAFYKNFHSFIHEKPEVEKRCSTPTNSTNKYSILVIGVDAMSRINMHRQLNSTVTFLFDKLGTIEMYGFNKVGDNTYPNLVPLLLGYDLRELDRVCWTSDKFPLDKCYFMWNRFAERGYRTLYAEDTPHIASFNYVKKGFFHQPTDYYFRHFILAYEDSLGRDRPLNCYECVGSTSETEAVLNWAQHFVAEFHSRPFFAFLWINSLTHDFLNKGSSGDHMYLKFFKNLYDGKYLNNTIVIMMGDHGMRWGSIRNTYVGRLEARLPMLLVTVPPKFQEEYPELTKTLKANAHRLVTPFDLYATFDNVLRLNEPWEGVNVTGIKEELAENFTKRAFSIFHPIPEDRACSEASIDEHWCACKMSVPVDPNDPDVKIVATFLVDFLNSLLESHSDLCAVLILSNITDSRIWSAPLSENKYSPTDDHVYTVTVQTKPGNAVFEGTVRLLHHNKTEPDLLGSISRLNLYGNQSACIDDAILRKYCYCS